MLDRLLSHDFPRSRWLAPVLLRMIDAVLAFPGLLLALRASPRVVADSPAWLRTGVSAFARVATRPVGLIGGDQIGDRRGQHGAGPRAVLRSHVQVDVLEGPRPRRERQVEG